MKQRMWMWQGAIILVAALGPTLLGVWLSYRLTTADRTAALVAAAQAQQQQLAATVAASSERAAIQAREEGHNFFRSEGAYSAERSGQPTALAKGKP